MPDEFLQMSEPVFFAFFTITQVCFLCVLQKACRDFNGDSSPPPSSQYRFGVAVGEVDYQSELRLSYATRALSRHELEGQQPGVGTDA
jgi:hypothetical protein